MRTDELLPRELSHKVLRCYFGVELEHTIGEGGTGCVIFIQRIILPGCDPCTLRQTTTAATEDERTSQ